MNVVFVSNFFNHHQKSFCDNLYTLLKGEFIFISTSPIPEDRINLGYDKFNSVKYIHEFSNDYDGLNVCLNIIDNADIVLFGSAPFKLIENRISKNKIVIKYSERIHKKGINLKKYIPRLLSWNIRYPFWKSVYLLSASAYAPYDYFLYGLFKNKAYKWGYFPENRIYDIAKLQSKKKRNNILWCGRLISWKHPEYVIELADRLRNQGKDFNINIIGNGPMESYLKQLVNDKNLDSFVYVLGAMNHLHVREYMETAGVYLATSDFGEGWGAVINESMNSGCAVVASHAMGSVPYLITHGQNGLIYKNQDLDDLYNKVAYLLDNPDSQTELGVKAFYTINDLWNAQIAAERFLKFAEELMRNGTCNLYEEGPCSKATTIKNNWFMEDL